MTDGKRVFLSGMIDGLPLEQAAGWRQEATRMLGAAGFSTYDPTARMLGVADYRPRPIEVFTNDTYYLRRSDVVLVNLMLPPTIETRKAPFFTIGEMFLAHQAGLPVIAFGDCFAGRAGYEAIVTRTFEALEPAVAYIVRNY